MKLPHPEYLQGTKGRHLRILLGRVSGCVTVDQTNEILEEKEKNADNLLVSPCHFILSVSRALSNF